MSSFPRLHICCHSKTAGVCGGIAEVPDGVGDPVESIIPALRFCPDLRLSALVVNASRITSGLTRGGAASVTVRLLQAFLASVRHVSRDNSNTTCDYESLKTVAVPGHQPNMQHRTRPHRPTYSPRVGRTSGGVHHDVALAGDRLVDGSCEPIEMLPERRRRGYSEALGLYVCWEDGMLRFFDPLTESHTR